MQGEIIMAYIGKYRFVLLGSVPRCVQRSLQCTLQDIQSGAVSGKRPGRGRGRRVIAVIVLLYTLSHSAISVLKIMSPSNEVRLLLLFIIRFHSLELRCAACLRDVFKGLFR